MEELVYTVNDCWPGSQLQNFSDAVLATSSMGIDYWPSNIAIGIFFFSLLFFKQILSAISYSISITISGNTPKECYDNQYVKTIITLTSILSVVVIDLVLYYFQFTNLPFWKLSVYLVALIVTRYIIGYVFKILRGRVEMWKSINANFKVSSIFSVFLLLPACIIFYLSEGEAISMYKYYTIFAFCLPYLTYLVRSTKIIFSLGCSIFFWFLYLCALEFLPIGIFISAIVRL